LLELQQAIQQWPVIIQGALGSALFALIMYLGQKLFAHVNHFISSVSNNSRISELTTEKLKLGMLTFRGEKSAIFAAPLVYRMSRKLLKALIWLVLGLIFGNFSNLLSVVGFLGSLYYLIIALNVVSPYETSEDSEERLQKINDELKKLKSNV